MTVEICVDGEPVADTTANLYRQDLEQAGKGNGFHAFEAELPKDCFDDGVHTLTLREIQSGTILSPRSDFKLDAREASDFKGEILGLSGGSLIGYAFHKANASEPVTVALMVNGQEFASATADEISPRGVAPDTPSRCGFSMSIAHLDPNKLMSGEAVIVAFPDRVLIGSYESFAKEFARLNVRKQGDVLVATIDVGFVPSHPVSFDLFVNDELYSTIDAHPDVDRISFPVTILARDPSVTTFSLAAFYCGTNVEIGNSPQTVQQKQNLVENSKFMQWQGATPKGWELSLPDGVGIGKAFVATGDQGAAQHKLVIEAQSDNVCVGESQFSQAIGPLPADMQRLDVFLEGRADRRTDIAVGLSGVAFDGSTVNVERTTTLLPSWGICVVRFDIPGFEGEKPVVLSARIASSDARRLEIGQVSAGPPGFALPGPIDATKRDLEPDNAISNGNFEYWRDALRLKATRRRIEIAENWMLTSKDRCPALEARLVEITKRDPKRGISAEPAYGLALRGPVVGKHIRLQTELNKLQLAHLDEGVFSCRLGKASGLSFHHDERKGHQSQIADIFISERAFFDAETFDDKKIFTLRTRVDIPLQLDSLEVELKPEQVEMLRSVANRILYDHDKRLVLSFEFAGAADCVLTDVFLGAKGKQRGKSSSGYVAIEDTNIAAQLPLLKGLEGWDGSERLYPPGAGNSAPVKANTPLWEWPSGTSRSVDIVICVHDAVEETLACLASVEACTELPHTVTIVDDASAGSTREQLRHYARGKPWVRLLSSEENLGYTKSANFGLMSSRADWVVLLNSDTIVSPGWLSGMFEVVAADPAVALVGPVSNAASWQSVPELNDTTGKWKVNSLPEGMSVNEMAELVARFSQRGFPEVPLLNGFCTLMRRRVLEEVGFLDESAFPIGYGEENDLCVRVGQAGYKLAIADHVYVYHVKSATFGKGRGQLAKQGAASFATKHPQVDLNKLQQVLAEATPLIELRKALRQHLGSGAKRQAEAVRP